MSYPEKKPSTAYPTFLILLLLFSLFLKCNPSERDCLIFIFKRNNIMKVKRTEKKSVKTFFMPISAHNS